MIIMKKSIKVSIICSVYNREKYINQCVDSILNSSLKDIELILIDNGCSDACPQIIDEYAKKDKRVIAVHNPMGSTYGYALNLGISMAQGKYIGIVESDDFIHHDMYKKLYDKAEKSKADVVFSGFFIHNARGDFTGHIHNKQIFENSDDKKLFSIKDYPFLLTCHQSIWAKLYRADFLKKIKFDEKGRYIDSAFIVDVCCSTIKIIAFQEALYYYCDDNPDASQSNTRSDKSLMRIIDDWEFAKTRLKHYGMYDILKEAFYYQASKASIRFYEYINKKYKKEFFNKYRKFLSELKQDKDFQYIYFEDNRKKFFQNVMANNFRATLYDEYKSFDLFRIPLFEKYIINDKVVKKLFGIKVYEKITKPDFIQRKFLYGLLSYSIHDGLKKYRLFGILEFCFVSRKTIKKHIDILRIDTFNLYFLQKSNIQAAELHRDTFLEYKNKYNGASIAVIGSGPTLSYSKIDKNFIKIGVNRVFLKDDIDLDYLFIQDYLKGGDMDAANNYRPESCVKFYGILPENRYNYVKESIRRISNEDICAAHAKPYIIEDCVRRNWANVLEIEPIGDWCGCVFSAMQFALYTNPKKIYLFGCDCSNNGHFHSERADVVNSSNLSYQYNSWISFKAHVERYYPNIEIISVNPVGLRGMFHDVYTREFLQKHPEIKNVEVLE